MLKTIRNHFKKHNDMAKTADYIAGHISRSLNDVAMFGKDQLEFLAISKMEGLTKTELNKIMKEALSKVIYNTKLRVERRESAIYLKLKKG